MNKNEYTKMTALFERSSLPLSEEQAAKFAIFYDMLIQYNDEFDLTRLKKFDDIIIKHFIDSLYFTRLVPVPSPLLDIGTGAGFPGIPLKIMTPQCSIILAEPKNKRVRFLDMVIRELGLTDIDVYPHMVTEKSFFNVRGVITRALESVDDTMSRVNHFLPEDGLVLFMKGPGAGKDLDAISPENSGLYHVDDDIEYVLPGTDHRRQIIICRKTASTFRKTYRIMKNEKETAGVPVTSEDNKRYRDIKKLTRSEGAKKEGKILVSGKKIIHDLLKKRNARGQACLVYDGYAEHDKIFDDILTEFQKSDALLILKKSLYNELDTDSTGSPLMVMDMPAMDDWDFSLFPGCSLMIPFQDPANVGALIRSAAGFGVDNIIMLQGSASPYHAKSIRASAGAVFTVLLHRGPSLEEVPAIADRNNIPLITLDRDGRDIADVAFPGNFILLPGVEGPGLPEILKMNAVAIPISGAVESLNAAISASLALYEWKRRQEK